MEVRIAHMTYDEVRDAIEARKLVILPTGATESHGPHMPCDTDTHQADHMAFASPSGSALGSRPPCPHAVFLTFEHFPGTVSLSIPIYQELVYEIGAALIGQGFEDLLILNGNRPNGTSNDAVARRLVDDLDGSHDFQVTAVSYWEPGAAEIDAMRNSEIGGMGHGGEFETSFQLATRPGLVKMHRIEGVYTPLVGWDLVAKVEPSRTYRRRPSPETNHASIFGNPHVASAEQGKAFIDAALDGLAAMIENLRPSYEERR